VVRGELGTHALECPRELVGCAVSGCAEIVARGDMDTHVGGDASAVARHMGAIAKVRVRCLTARPYLFAL